MGGKNKGNRLKDITEKVTQQTVEKSKKIDREKLGRK